MAADSRFDYPAGVLNASHVWLTGDVHQKLLAEAAKREIHPDQLLSALATTVLAADGAIEVILSRLAPI